MPVVLCARFLSVDLFRTLIVPKENVILTYSNFGQRHLDYGFDHSILMSHFTDVYAALERKWPNFGNRDGIAANRWWNEIIVQTLARSSPFSEAHVRRILKLNKTNWIYDYFASEDAWQLMPSTMTGLQSLADTGIKMCILSNSDERTPFIVKALKMDHFFKFVFYSTSCNYMKPDREIFELVSSRFFELDGRSETSLETRMAQYVHVGDSETRDYWGAQKAGCGGAFLVGPCVTCNDKSLEVDKHTVYTPCCSDSFTSWAYLDDPVTGGYGKIPSRHIVRSLSELAERLTLRNRVVAKNGARN